MKFRKKPIVIEAVKWTGTADSMDGIRAIDTGTRAVDFTHENVFILTLEGQMTANLGDWIIRGVSGELYPCKPDIFAMTYEPAEGCTTRDDMHTCSPLCDRPICVAVRKAVEAEREACAKLCEENLSPLGGADQYFNNGVKSCVKDIRARSK